jgi:hypothetical protein
MVKRARRPLTQSVRSIALVTPRGRDRRGWIGNTALPQQTPADRPQAALPGKVACSIEPSTFQFGSGRRTSPV